MLEHEKTMKLIALAQQGDNEAKTLLLNENRPLIKSIIRRYANKGVEYDDLIQIASVGFLKAVTNFCEDYNVRFSTYAVPMILGEVKRYMRDDGYVKISRSIKTLSAKIFKYIEEVRQSGGVEPTIFDLSKKFDVDITEVVFALDCQKQPFSLYEKTEDDEQGLSLIEKLSDGNKEDKIIDSVILKNVIAQLTEREKKIIMLRYYRDMTQSEIAKLMGVSQVQVSRLENKILTKIKQQFVE